MAEASLNSSWHEAGPNRTGPHSSSTPFTPTSARPQAGTVWTRQLISLCTALECARTAESLEETRAAMGRTTDPTQTAIPGQELIFFSHQCYNNLNETTVPQGLPYSHFSSDSACQHISC